MTFFGTVKLGIKELLNKKKTVLCCINEKWENLPELMARVQETGFSVGTGVLPLLGLDISLDGNQDEKRIWDPVLRKLNGTIFKSRALNLPLSGKVAVVKTFCLSSIAYTARMVTLPTFYKDRISDYIVNFINSGGSRFSEEIIFKATKSNGLGIPRIEDFCRALLCKNLSRFLKNTEIWGHVFRAKFVEGQPDRCLTNNKISFSLKGSAEAMVDAEFEFLSKQGIESILSPCSN